MIKWIICIIVLGISLGCIIYAITLEQKLTHERNKNARLRTRLIELQTKHTESLIKLRKCREREVYRDEI